MSRQVMSDLIEMLEAKLKQHRANVTAIESVVALLKSERAATGGAVPAATATSSGLKRSVAERSVFPNPSGEPKAPSAEYANLTQSGAVLKALEHGPQTTREIFDRLTAAGLKLSNRVYVTALLGRIRDKIERDEDGKVRLKKVV